METSVENTENKAQSPAATQASSGLKIEGRFARYTSAFWQIIIPLLSARYLVEGLGNLLDVDWNLTHWKMTPEEKAKKESKWHQEAVEDRLNNKILRKYENKGVARWLSTNVQAITFGSVVAAVTAVYTARTSRDVKNLYREAVGYELGIPAEKVNLHDLRKSKNSVVSVTTKALTHRTAYRFAAISSFFMPWGPAINKKKYHYTDELNEVGLRMGTGVMGGYLFTDGFLRKESFFEASQHFVDNKINHVDGNQNDRITADDIARLIVLQKGHDEKNYKAPAPASEQWQNTLKLSDQIADEMNKAYHNTPGDSNLTFGKFVYLQGMGLLNQFPESMGYVELASKTQGVAELKQVAAAIKGGANPESVFQDHGVSLSRLTPQPAQQPEIENTPSETRHTDRVQPAQGRMLTTPRSHQDYAVQGAGASLTP